MDVRHDYDGNPRSHRKAHLWNSNGKSYSIMVSKFVYPKRLFILAISIPAQRYTSWTGDNVASWEHLWIANIQVQRMSISGMGFTGFEIFLEQPSGELYARWMAFFHPFAGLTHLEITAIKNPGL
jgi:alpha-glucosidase